MKTILYLGYDWAGNIGNAFIDLTINHCLKTVIGGKDFYVTGASNLPAYLKYNFVNRKPFKWFKKTVSKEDFDLRQHIKADYVVMGAALLDIYWCKVHECLLNYLIEQQTKVIILGGGGGNSYSREEIEYVKSIWRRINVVAFISRDYQSYDNYKDIFSCSYAGIDNAFFLKDAFVPAKLDIENLGVKTFDLTRNHAVCFPDDYTVVTTRHRLLDVDSMKFAFRHGLATYRIVSDTDMISDCPEDYLHLYGNSKITHSDRVHACVATLSFGGKARYYDNSDRSFLFERVGLANIKTELVQLDQNFIMKEKQKQLDFLKNILL